MQNKPVHQTGRNAASNKSSMTYNDYHGDYHSDYHGDYHPSSQPIKKHHHKLNGNNHSNYGGHYNERGAGYYRGHPRNGSHSGSQNSGGGHPHAGPQHLNNSPHNNGGGSHTNPHAAGNQPPNGQQPPPQQSMSQHSNVILLNPSQPPIPQQFAMISPYMHQAPRMHPAAAHHQTAPVQMPPYSHLTYHHQAPNMVGYALPISSIGSSGNQQSSAKYSLATSNKNNVSVRALHIENEFLALPNSEFDLLNSRF